VAHSLHRHSESLVNAFERVALRVVQEIMKHQYSPTGPTLGSHKGELPFQAKPPLPYALAALELHGSQPTSSTRWEVTLWITSSSASCQRRSRTDTCVLIYQTAKNQYIRCRGRLEEFPWQMLTNKCG
jgi:hypothetical protein